MLKNTMNLNNHIHYYSEDGTKFSSKVSAVEYSQKTGQEVKFYFYDDVYSKVDWKKELPHDLDYYYKQQALRLREKYDYLILTYSGGSDSTCILETFAYNNIKLDKIVSVGAFSKDSAWGVDENHNGEIYHNVIPYIKELGLESITDIIDYTEYLKDDNFKYLSIYEHGENWAHEIGGYFSVHNFFWRDAEKILVPKEWKNKKVGLIFGTDKPNVVLSEDGSPSLIFTDTCVTYYGNSLGFENVDRIRFFWDPNFTDIIVKQTQKIKAVGHFLGGEKNIAKIVYDLKKPLNFQSPKTSNFFWSLRDTYLREMKQTELFKFYSEGLKLVESKVGFKNMNPIASKKHLI